ncbi:MAG: hypothetical protein A3D41_04125 [Candidatus Sungbacteria bacterium RIFCSPHIGHO2_02_FULL_41_12b]|nr:MAG: hypothetical protein A3D41_04125 [Candidatus Sungbacteria bacterium RIFCSPHIGHO2_02_FULL_41_12b]
MFGFIKDGHVFGECKRSGLGLWECPPFLFIVMGFINICAMLGSYFLASRYTDEPMVAALVVVSVSVLILVIGNFIISGFNKIAEANLLKSEFISIVSHQLRSPLSIFKWTMDILIKESEGQKFNRDDGMYLNILKENTERMIQLVSLLLEANRIESNRSVLARNPIPLYKITEDMVNSVIWYAKAYNVEIELHPLLSPPDIIGDMDRVKMVVQNLIDNAIRYSRGKGKIDVYIKSEGRFLKWEIHDDGVGIPREQQKFIFQKFFRSDNAVKHQTQGSGLGLFIAKAVVEELGGEIGFKSEIDTGSTFWFTLPIKP